MKKVLATIMTSILCLFVLAACGEKSQEDVLKDLSKKMDTLEGYKTKAVMEFHNGKEKQTYYAKIWHKAKNFYKVVLNSKDADNKQMIIKNKNGVFVLTPALDKKYRFQSKWPNNRSQYYLYQSLITDILNDPSLEFEVKEDKYVFKTQTNYRTKELANQKIVLSKKNLAPLSVQIMDKDMTTVIDVSFKDFNFNPEFKKNSFDEDAEFTKATMGQTAKDQKSKEFTVLRPDLNWKQSELKKVQPVTKNGTQQYVLIYEGKKPFTLIESPSDNAETAVAVPTRGKPVNLGFAVGAMSKSSLSWTYNGVDFYLASKKLSPAQMQEVARSVNGHLVK